MFHLARAKGEEGKGKRKQRDIREERNVARENSWCNATEYLDCTS